MGKVHLVCSCDRRLGVRQEKDRKERESIAVMCNGELESCDVGAPTVYLMVTLCRVAVLCLLLIAHWQIILHGMGWGVQSLLCICCNIPNIRGSHVTLVKERGLNAGAAMWTV